MYWLSPSSVSCTSGGLGGGLVVGGVRVTSVFLPYPSPFLARNRKLSMALLP